MHPSIGPILPKHLRLGDLRPNPRLRKIEGYLPAPSTAGPNGNSEKPPAPPKGGANPVQVDFAVETTPDDWVSTDGDTSGGNTWSGGAQLRKAVANMPAARTYVIV